MAGETTSNGGAYALELVNISVDYGGVAALDGADIGVRDGEAAAMGPNGAGKSTVLKAVMGLAPVVGGEVRWLRFALGFALTPSRAQALQSLATPALFRAAMRFLPP